MNPKYRVSFPHTNPMFSEAVTVVTLYPDDSEQTLIERAILQVQSTTNYVFDDLHGYKTKPKEIKRCPAGVRIYE